MHYLFGFARMTQEVPVKGFATIYFEFMPHLQSMIGLLEMTELLQRAYGLLNPTPAEGVLV